MTRIICILQENQLIHVTSSQFNVTSSRLDVTSSDSPVPVTSSRVLDTPVVDDWSNDSAARRTSSRRYDNSRSIDRQQCNNQQQQLVVVALSDLMSDMQPQSASDLWHSLVDVVIKTVLVSQPQLYSSYQHS